MPAMPAAPESSASGTGTGGASRPTLGVHPFRGVRYDPARVSDLAAVTSPPYDVIDADSADHLEQLDPHNVVRLILPRPSGADGRGRYHDAAQRLATWLGDGTLRQDDQPTLYVYEQSGHGLLQRGILAAVDLRDPADHVVLPHEDVMAGPVADRLDLMRATGANLEPILLVYEGGGETAMVIEQVAGGAPDLETTTEDGLRQRVWAVTEPALHRRVADDLAPRQALIADGHHRYATYRRLQAERRADGDEHGPWDRGLALLVDSRTHPLRVQAIHRVVEGLSYAAALRALGETFAVQQIAEPAPQGGDPAAQRAGETSRDPAAVLDRWLSVLDSSSMAHPFLLTDGQAASLVGDPDRRAVAGALEPLQSDLWRSLDASVLHALVLGQLFGLSDSDARVRYVHDPASALRAAARSDGVALLMRPVDVSTVLAVAALGERMPRKSTSFGPKPRTGLVIRLLDEERGEGR
jgi:uncharacterized protein (DUF1015 family)